MGERPFLLGNVFRNLDLRTDCFGGQSFFLVFGRADCLSVALLTLDRGGHFVDLGEFVRGGTTG